MNRSETQLVQGINVFKAIISLIAPGRAGAGAGDAASGLEARARNSVFREDVLRCPCGGGKVVLAFVTEKKEWAWW